MKYRTLGKTGLSVSALGFGAMRLPEKNGKVNRRASERLIRAGIDGGITYLDTAPLYCHSLSEEILGRAIKGYDRRKLVLSTKNPEQKDVNKWWEHLHTSLKRLGGDYIDLYHFWGIKGRELRENIAPPGMCSQARKAKEQGKIRHIAFSFHDDAQEIYPIIDSGLFSAMTVQFSLLDRKLSKAIYHAHEKGLGVVIMGPLAGGRLAHSSLLLDILSPNTKERISLGLRFVLSQPGVTLALSGMSSESQLTENLQTAGGRYALSPSERKRIEQFSVQQAMQEEIPCTNCGYCLPCPQKVNIPYILGALEQGLIYGLWAYAQERLEYQRLNPRFGKNMDKCTLCAECEEKCPQGLKISELMQVAKEKLGNSSK
jgi:predicted aldo/keto reductase-like oxidoreductase